MLSLKHLKLKRYGTVLLLLFGVGIYGWYLWTRSLRTEQFQDAMERQDFEQAERLWERGVRATTDNPYAQFMRIRDRIRSVSGAKVESWKVSKLQAINETNRYFGTFDIQDSTARFGVGLIWEGEKWKIKPDYPELPSYVRNSLNGD